MGLFDKIKKKKETQTNDSSSEFDRDIRELLARDDITCRPEICDAEYKKAISLIEGKPTESQVHRCYDIMGNLATQFEYAPAMVWMGDFAENVMNNLEQAVYWYKKAADNGDGNGARNYADMLMAGNGVRQDMQTAIMYYTKAAEAGIPEALFVIGELLRNNGESAKALEAYKEAYNKGYEPALIRINQMES